MKKETEIILIDILRWAAYGWEWRVIRNLLISKHGVNLCKCDFLDIVEGADLPAVFSDFGVVKTYTERQCSQIERIFAGERKSLEVNPESREPAER